MHPDATMHNCDEQLFLSELVHPRWCAVLTCIGGTMANAGANPKFGLASDDDEGRAAAIGFAAKTLEAVGRWNSRPFRTAPRTPVRTRRSP